MKYLSQALFLLGITLATISGCGGSQVDYEGPPRFQVTGAVSIDGKPVPDGSINFIPLDGGRKSYAGIIDGAYTVEEGKGPNAGKYKVEVYGNEVTGEAVDEDLGPPTKDIVPPKFNVNTSLEIEITEGGPDANKHDFILTN